MKIVLSGFLAMVLLAAITCAEPTPTPHPGAHGNPYPYDNT